MSYSLPFFLAIMKYPMKSSLKKKVHLGLRFEVIQFITVGWHVTSSSVVVREYGTHTLTSQRVRDRESEEEQIYSPPRYPMISTSSSEAPSLRSHNLHS